MITIIRKTLNSEVEEIKKILKGSWIHLYKPTDEEIKRVHKKTRIPRDYLRAALDEAERPRIEKEKNTTLIILRTAVKNSIVKTIPLSIIITPNYFVTVSLEKLDFIEDFFTGKIKNFSTRKRSRLLMQIFVRIIRTFIKHLNKIEDEIELTEYHLKKRLNNEDIIKLLKHEKTLVYFNTSLLSNGSVLERISKGRIIKLYEEDEDILDDVIIDNKQAAEMTRVFSDILSHTTDAYASLINNNLNIVMKFLTAITIILSIPMIISGYYGMNVKLPIQQNPQAFWIIILISLIIMYLSTLLFARKNWL